MTFEVVEACAPQRAVRREPLVDRAQWFGADAVDAALPVDARVDQAGLAQDAEVLRYCGLTDGQRLDELADGLLAGEQQVEDPTPVRLGHDFEELQCSHSQRYYSPVI